MAKNNQIVLGRIIAEDQNDYDYITSYLSKYPIAILHHFPKEQDFELDTIIVGWEKVKSRFPTQNILDKQIDEKTSWTFSKEYDEKIFSEDIEKFIEFCIKQWLPKQFLVFDPILGDDNLEYFLEKNIDKAKLSYIYFHKDAMYIKNKDANLIVNIKSLSLINLTFREAITNFLNSYKNLCFSYSNIGKYVNLDNLHPIKTFESLRWIKLGVETNENYFQVIPGVDLHKYIPFLMSNVSIVLNDDEKKSINRMCKRDELTEWMSNRYINFSENFYHNNLDFIYRDRNKFAKIKFSNKRTLTGRVTSVGPYDIQKLNKQNDERSYIVSRFPNGKIIVLDYISFETRIAMYLSGDEEFIKNNQNKDLHSEIAKIIFNKQDNIIEGERDLAKSITHAFLYGSSREKILERLKECGDTELIYQNICRFFSPILKKAKEIEMNFMANGYIKTDWGTIIRPTKNYASFNNYIQSAAAEIIIDKVDELRGLLKTKKTQFLFQNHDAVVLDMPYEERLFIKDILTILSNVQGKTFILSYKTGSNYKFLSREFLAKIASITPSLKA